MATRCALWRSVLLTRPVPRAFPRRSWHPREHHVEHLGGGDYARPRHRRAEGGSEVFVAFSDEKTTEGQPHEWKFYKLSQRETSDETSGDSRYLTLLTLNQAFRSCSTM